MSAQDMHEAARCQHVKLSGKQCKAPARRGTSYCLFHQAEHFNDGKLAFPPVEDAASVAVAADQVIQALCDDTIEFRRAGLLLSGLRLARINLKQLGLELGDAVESAPMTKQEKEDAYLEGLPSLKEILLTRLNELEAEMAREAGEPAPTPVDIAKALASEATVADILMEHFDQEAKKYEEAGSAGGLAEQVGRAPENADSSGAEAPSE